MTDTSIRDHVAVVVLGMHRSGTSVLTKALETAGVFLGDRLMPGKEDNPKGFFEDLDIAAINIDILGEMGCRWDSVFIKDWQELPEERRNHYLEKAVRLVEERFGAHPLWGFKDPRVTRLLTFWDSVFAKTGMRSVCIASLRHPLSVADSLAKRDRMPLGQSLLLWLLHEMEVLAVLLARRSLVVDYDILMENPEKELARLCEFLEVDRDPACGREFLADFLSTSLRHSRYPSAGDDTDDGWLGEACGRCYRLLRAWAMITGTAVPPELVSETERELLDLRKQVAAQQSVLEALESIQEKGWQLDAELQAAHEKVHTTQVEMHAAHAEAYAVHTELHATNGKLHAALTDLHTLRGELEHWREQLWAERSFWKHQAQLNRAEAENLRNRLCTVESKLWHRTFGD